jgi:hypothetical protein
MLIYFSLSPCLAALINIYSIANYDLRTLNDEQILILFLQVMLVGGVSLVCNSLISVELLNIKLMKMAHGYYI